ncbi:MAG: glycosyltransferase family 2 protein [Myxococcota bacterium]
MTQAGQEIGGRGTHETSAPHADAQDCRWDTRWDESWPPHSAETLRARLETEPARICLLIPAFNEALTLPGLVEALRRHYPQLPIVVVDDGSHDQTGRLAEAQGATVLRHARNRGYAAALQTGYTFVMHQGFEAVIQLDADGQHPPEEVAHMLAALERREADLVVGSRFSGRGVYPVGWLKGLAVGVLRHVVRQLTGLELRDPTSGFQALNRRCLAQCLGGALPPDYPDAELLVRLHRAGMHIQEVPVRMSPAPRPSRMYAGLRPLHYLYRNVLALTALARERR